MATVIQNRDPDSDGNSGALLAVVVIVVLVLGFFAYFGYFNGGGSNNAGDTAPVPQPDVNTTEVQNEITPEQPSEGDFNVDVPDEIDVNIDNQE